MVGGLAWWGARCTFYGDRECDDDGPNAVMASGIVLGAGSVLYSLIDAPRAAQRHNARARRLLLTPMPMVGPEHSAGFGLHLSGQF